MKPSQIMVVIQGDDGDLYPMWTTYTPIRSSISSALEDAIKFMREMIERDAIHNYGAQTELARLRKAVVAAASEDAA